MFRRILMMMAFVLPGFVVGTFGFPTAANAFVCEIFDCGSFGVAYSVCDIGSVDVAATQQRHRYSFTILCNGQRAQVKGAYDYGTGRAEEAIEALDGSWRVQERWTCQDDPWVAPGQLACSNGKISSKGKIGSFDVQRVDYPISPWAISAQSRHVLAAQLNNALKAAPSAPLDPATPVKPLPPDTVDNNTSDVLKNLGNGPDLTVIRIDGPTALAAGQSGTYTFIVGNVGNVVASVEVNLLFAGALTQTGGVSADSGLGCSIGPGGGKVNASATCNGGQLDAQRSATITVQAVGLNPGSGSVIASINNSRSLAETDYGNNVGRRDVSVN